MKVRIYFLSFSLISVGLINHEIGILEASGIDIDYQIKDNKNEGVVFINSFFYP